MSNCAIYIAANMMKILKDNALTLRLKIDPIRDFQHLSRGELDIIGNYFLNSVQYPDIAYFIFKQSNLWIGLINSFVLFWYFWMNSVDGIIET